MKKNIKKPATEIIDVPATAGVPNWIIDSIAERDPWLVDLLGYTQGPTTTEVYMGKKCYSRDAKKSGTITSLKRCSLEGCTGVRLGVKWSDGRRTWPCSKGVKTYRRGFRII